MNILDRLRLSERQEVVVALLMAGAATEALAAEVILHETELLDLRSHGAIHDEDAFSRRLGELPQDFRTIRLGRDVSKRASADMGDLPF